MSHHVHSVVRLQLRLPSDLAEHLRQQAALNLRSLNNEMVSQLEQNRRSVGDVKAKKVKG